MDDGFVPVQTVRLHESVVAQVLDLIGRGELSPGDRLPPERDLAQRLAISRNVLREAFRVLEARGIVHSRGGGGRYIRAGNVAHAFPVEGVILRLEKAVITDVLESRELLETQVARLAAERAEDAGVASVRRACEVTDGSWADNVRFHTAVAAATGNFMLERLVRLQMDVLSDVGQRKHYTAAAVARLLAEHRAIAEAIAAHDPDKAERAVRAHFAHTRTAVGSC